MRSTELCLCILTCFRFDASCELHVEFKDEQGIDGGGLTKTFLSEVSVEFARATETVVVSLILRQVLDKLIAPGLLFIPVVINHQIAYLRINPTPHVIQRSSSCSSDPLYNRTDECLKLLGVAIAHSLQLGNYNFLASRINYIDWFVVEFSRL